MASTVITTNATALARAADKITSIKTPVSKNAALNALAASIAGPGHDWGFLKNAPSGHFTQPGIQAEESTPAPSSIWIVLYDEQEEWAHEPHVFFTKEAALQFIAGDHAWWRHASHPFAEVITELKNSGNYHFTSDDDGASSYSILLNELPIQDATPTSCAERDLADIKPHADAYILLDAPAPHHEQGLDDDQIIFSNLEEADAYGNRIDQDSDDWSETLYRADTCTITATFHAQKWINDYGYPADPQGPEQWVIDPDELESGQTYLDYLTQSRNAPGWIKTWGGPFEVSLDIQPPKPRSE